MNKFKLRLYRIAQKKAEDFARTYGKDITGKVEPLLFHLNHSCFFNAADYIFKMQNPEGSLSDYENCKLWSDDLLLVYCHDSNTGAGFLHVIVRNEDRKYPARGAYLEATLGYLAPRHEYYVLKTLPGHLGRADDLFNNARLDFIKDLELPWYYKHLFDPSDLI